MKKRPVPAERNASPGIWSGTISFSLVAIPVRLVSAVVPRVSFRLLHSRDHSPLERKMVCPKDGKVVPPEEMIRGYEIAAGRYLTISDQELESVSPERSRTIEITQFIDLSEVDPLYYDRPHYLIPLKGGEKAYRLLAEAMKRANKAGVAKFVLGEREYLVLIKNRDGALEASTLHYSDEVLPAPGISKTAKASPEGTRRIRNIIKEMSAPFAPKKYPDRRREALLELIRAKLHTKAEVRAPEVEEEEETGGMVDLMAALQESMRKLKKADEQKNRKRQ